MVLASGDVAKLSGMVFWIFWALESWKMVEFSSILSRNIEIWWCTKYGGVPKKEQNQNHGGNNNNNNLVCWPRRFFDFPVLLSSCSGVLEKEAQTQSGLGKTLNEKWNIIYRFKNKVYGYENSPGHRPRAC